MSIKRNQNLPENIPPIYYTFETTKDYTFADITLFHAYDFFDWWYIKMPTLLFKVATRITKVAIDRLSFALLLRTFLVPWHRDTKLVGYFMGIMVRIVYLPIALIIILTVSSLSFASILLWILLPIISLIMFVLSPIIA